jgi:hypothetical protein
MGRTKLIGIFALVCCAPWREQQTEVSKLRAENDSLALTAERADGVRLDGLQIPPARRSVDEALKDALGLAGVATASPAPSSISMTSRRNR